MSSTSLNRQRAFTLFLRAYDEVRDALAFLSRKQDDVDALVPSLYTARNTRRKPPEAEVVDSRPDEEPGASGSDTPVAAEEGSPLIGA